MQSRLDQERLRPRVATTSFAEVTLAHRHRVAVPLGRPRRLSDALARWNFLSALTAAIGTVAAARLMNLAIFDGVPGTIPDFFVVITTFMLIIPFAAMCIRQLRDAGIRFPVLSPLLTPFVARCVMFFHLRRPTRGHAEKGGR